jgi:hypothetical protein
MNEAMFCLARAGLTDGDLGSAWNAYNAGRHEQYMARATMVVERGTLWAPRPWLGAAQ